MCMHGSCVGLQPGRVGCSLRYEGLQVGLVNGHAHIGHGEGGAVIDAVTDHADDGVRLEQLDLDL